LNAQSGFTTLGQLGQSEGKGYQDTESDTIIKWHAKRHAANKFLRLLKPLSPF